MPLGPKITPEGTLANETIWEDFERFTNRESETVLIKERIGAATGEPLPILMFFGVAGQGKSWLIRKFRETVRPIQGLRVAQIDFHGGYSTQKNDWLCAIRTQLRCPTPRFDIALTALEERGLINLSNSFSREKGEIGDFGETIANDATELLDGLPFGAGFAIKVVRKIGERVFDKKEAKALRKWFRSELGKSFRDNFKSQVRESLTEIPKLLISYLALDFSEFLPRRTNKACRGVVFLDTFEHLSRGGLSDIQQIEDREKWIYDLWEVCHDQPDGSQSENPSPFLQIVIAGRDRIRWDEQNLIPTLFSDIQKHRALETHRIGGLSETDSCHFLDKCKIYEPKLRSAILGTSLDTNAPHDEKAYHAFALGLCADTFRQEQINGRSLDPDSFKLPPGETLQLATRFRSSLRDSAEKRRIERLALTPEFDRQAVAELLSINDPNNLEIREKTNEILRFSFVEFVSSDKEQPENGKPPLNSRFRVHALMREAVNSTRSEEEANEDHQYWYTHWTKFDVRDLAWYHLWCIDPGSALEQWSDHAEDSRKNLEMILHSTLLDWWAPTGLLQATPETEIEARALLNLGKELTFSKVHLNSNPFQDAESILRASQKFWDRSRDSEACAECEHYLGYALQLQAKHGKLENKGRLYSKAVAAYRRALEVRTHDKVPQEWADTQNGLGNALRPLADLSEGEEKSQLLSEAVAAYRCALEVRTRASMPQEWAKTQNNLGGISWTQSFLTDGIEKANILRNGEEAYNRALEEIDHVQMPLEWAQIQQNLGINFMRQQSLADGKDKIRLMNKAAAAYRRSFKVLTRDQTPREWAATQRHLGGVLWTQGKLAEGEEKARLLSEAAAAYRYALDETTRDKMPEVWAQIQRYLGGVLWAQEELAEDEEKARLLSEAAAAYRYALDEITHDKKPEVWALLQQCLGVVLWSQGKLAEGEEKARLLNEAAAAIRDTLEKTKRDEMPQLWAKLQRFLDVILREQR